MADLLHFSRIMTSPVRILAVDDERLIRMSLRYALAREGYEVETASSGAEAMKRIASERFDLVLLDLRLGDLDGREVLRFLHEHDPSTKVILVTASTNAPTLAEARRQGAASVVVKPFSLTGITAETRRVLRQGPPPPRPSPPREVLP